MFVYVVTKSGGGEKDAIAIFSSGERAIDYLKKHNFKGRIEHHEVDAGGGSPLAVYAAHRLGEAGSRYFIGLYSRRDDAKIVAGDTGIVRRFGLDCGAR
jgi:hypothetical protein